MPATTIKYRPHRGGLAEAMAECVDLPATLDAVVAHLIATGWADYGDLVPTRDNVGVEPYCGADDRIGWPATWVVRFKNTEGHWVVGFTSGPVT